jgi:hypothetical protein
VRDTAQEAGARRIECGRQRFDTVDG